MSTAAFLVIALANPLGCAGWNEAFRDRVTDQKPTVRFGCAAFAPAAQTVETAVVQTPLFLRGAPDPVPPIVGELFQWHDQKGIPVTIAGRLPNAVLVSDARAILVSLGYTVTDEASSATTWIDLDIVRLGAGQIPAGLMDLRGTTVAQIDLRIGLARGEESARAWEISQREEIRAAYFLTSDIERALEGAYCRLLGDLDALFRSPEFRGAAAQGAAAARPGRFGGTGGTL